ncbi:hypothetical protein CLU79DRAFT_778395 [Phycomyces nitens]|nr:hypothetical protein CLU79DRAFT_778395 [Phycomyces nitens]
MIRFLTMLASAIVLLKCHVLFINTRLPPDVTQNVVDDVTCSYIKPSTPSLDICNNAHDRATLLFSAIVPEYQQPLVLIMRSLSEAICRVPVFPSDLW